MKNVYRVVLYRPDLNPGGDKQHSSEELYIAANAAEVVAALAQDLNDESVSFDSLSLVGPVLRDLTLSSPERPLRRFDAEKLLPEADIPADVRAATLCLQAYFFKQNISHWKLGPVQSS